MVSAKVADRRRRRRRRKTGKGKRGRNIKKSIGWRRTGVDPPVDLHGETLW